MSDKWGELDRSDYYHIPRTCRKCGMVMVFQGLGEYKCEECGYIDYDDYGKVRAYIEKHRGATALTVERATGVPQRTIQKLLKESRIQIAADSKVFMRCEMCGAPIRSGELCNQCELVMHRSLEERQREQLRKENKGYGAMMKGDEGQRRFMRGADD